MGCRTRVWLALAAQLALAAAVVARLRPPLTAMPAALAAGMAAGLVLFVVLSRRVRLRLPGRATPVLGALLGVIVVAAAAEEAVWRVGAPAVLARAVPAPLAVVLAVAAFAVAHAERQGLRGVATHAVSGSAFMAVYLATGRLLPAAAAHALYNVLIACAAPAARAVPLSASVAAASVAEVPAVGELAVRFSGVGKRYRAAVALVDVDLTLRRGEIACLLGPNGAGKSTAVSLLIGLRRPDAGSVSILGGDPRSPRIRRRLGVLAQEVGFPGTLRLREVVELAAAHFDRPEDVDSLLDRFALHQLATRQVGGLSGGERRRLGIALAFVGRPDLLVLDEPTVGLDVAARARTWAEVETFALGGGTVLFTTHHLDEAATVATTAFVLSRGRLVAEGPLHEIRAGAGCTRISLLRQPLPVVPGVVRRDEEGVRTTLLVEDVEVALDALRRADVDLAGLEVRSAGLEELLRTLATGDDR